MVLRNFSRQLILCLYRRLYRKSFSQNYTCETANILSSDVTAGVLIIGDEILNGHTDDANSPFFIKNLNLAGIKVKKVALVPDDVDMIAKEVKELSQICTVVLTSGGIGPTHDDVTYEAVAKACGDELKINEELSSLFSEYFGILAARQNPALLKFSSIPKSAVLNYSAGVHINKVKFPLISVKNIYMFPGVPTLLQRAFEVFKSNFLWYNEPHFTKSIFIAIDEFSVTPLLNKAVEEFKVDVKFGSYPTFCDNYYKVKLVLRSSSAKSIQKAYDYFECRLPKGSIVDLKKDILLSAKDDVYALCKTSSSVSAAVTTVEEALTRYELSEIGICFNGGKDCTALLHLLYSCVQQLKPHKWGHVHVLYVETGDTFREVDDFISVTVKKYNLNLVTLSGDMKEATRQYLKNHPQIKAVFMGTRRCDPGGEKLKAFSETDGDWPIVIRILPILDWSYSCVWSFIRELQIPYCVLYDRGYTSLGTKSQTVRNPSLLIPNSKSLYSYKPAYMLSDCSEERSSRL